MKKLWQLSGRQLRSSRRLVRQLSKRRDAGHPSTWFRGSTDFRILERLYRAGLVDVRVSKWAYIGGPRGYPFRELEVSLPGTWLGRSV